MDSKLIGKGAFSNVYLIKERCAPDDIFSLEEDLGNFHYYVVKKINILKLVDKYTLNKLININNGGGGGGGGGDQKDHLLTISHQMTPANKNKISENDSDDSLYYKKKIQQLIQSEVDLLSNIYHQNIVKMHEYHIDISEIKFEYSLKFEYMNMGDLGDLLKNKTVFESYRNEFKGFDNILCKYIIENILEGINFLHILGIIHRDIKLQNILIKKTDRKGKELLSDYKIKISDFGFACIDPNVNLNANFPKFLINTLSLKYQKICGTPYYMAPEIILNMKENSTTFSDYSFNCDVWSLGVCLYELYFNSLPLQNIDNIQDIISFYQNDDSQKKLNYKINKINGGIIKKILLDMLIINKFARHSIIEIITLFKKCVKTKCF